MSVENGLYVAADFRRELELVDDAQEPYRSAFRRDYGRIIHSPAFRRLQGKTQLFPGDESDFFRNRLTHSLEVGQIAKSIALRLNHLVARKGIAEFQIDTDLVELAALAHDLGHPPFGHTGEAALDECMRRYGGFEGNAQTLRILARLEKRQTAQLENDDREFVEFHDGRDYRLGLNLSYRSLASILKYDKVIPVHRPRGSPLAKGYYATEQQLVDRVKSSVRRTEAPKQFKTIEMQIMDLADDIAYSTYDLEDALKAGFASPLDLISQINDTDVAVPVARKLFKDRYGRDYQTNPSKEDLDKFSDLRDAASQVVLDMLQDFLVQVAKSLELSFHQGGVDSETLWQETASQPDLIASVAMKLETLSKSVSNNGYVRSKFTSYLVSKRLTTIDINIDKDDPALSVLEITEDNRFEIDVLKHLTFELHIKSPRLRLVESRGKQVVTELFHCFDNDTNGDLLPMDWRQRLRSISEFPDKESHRKRLVCDYIAGMTDAYALDMYARLKSANPTVLFRPT